MRQLRTDVPATVGVGLTAAFAHFALDSETSGPWVFYAALGSGAVGLVIGRLTVARRREEAAANNRVD